MGTFKVEHNTVYKREEAQGESCCLAVFDIKTEHVEVIGVALRNHNHAKNHVA